jgi:hypothetical protein
MEHGHRVWLRRVKDRPTACLASGSIQENVARSDDLGLQF